MSETSSISFTGEDTRTEELDEIDSEEDIKDRDALIQIYINQSKAIQEMRNSFTEAVSKLRSQFNEYVEEDRQIREKMLNRICQLNEQISRFNHLNSFEKEQRKDIVQKRKLEKIQEEKERKKLNKERKKAKEARRRRLEKLGLDPDACYDRDRNKDQAFSQEPSYHNEENLTDQETKESSEKHDSKEISDINM